MEVSKSGGFGSFCHSSGVLLKASVVVGLYDVEYDKRRQPWSVVQLPTQKCKSVLPGAKTPRERAIFLARVISGLWSCVREPTTSRRTVGYPFRYCSKDCIQRQKVDKAFN
jgi:hypothetical protein